MNHEIRHYITYSLAVTQLNLQVNRMSIKYYYVSPVLYQLLTNTPVSTRKFIERYYESPARHNAT